MLCHFGYRCRDNSVTPYNSAASRGVFVIPKISHIIRHRTFVLQGGCIFLKNTQTTCSFQIGKKKPDEEKIYRWTEFFFFFTSCTITSEKCTRAHVQENKSIYLWKVYIYMKTFLKTGVYIYIYNRYGQKTNDHKKSSNIKQNVTSLKKVLALKELLYALWLGLKLFYVL